MDAHDMLSSAGVGKRLLQSGDELLRRDRSASAVASTPGGVSGGGLDSGFGRMLKLPRIQNGFASFMWVVNIHHHCLIAFCTL